VILIGRYLSPYARRVATTLNTYNLPFEHQPLQHTGDDAPHLRQINPIGRVPALVVSDDMVVVESSAILDYLDREVGAERALIPASGDARTRAMSMLGVATGSIDKAISCAYEIRFRPEEKRHAAWTDRCAEQAVGGYDWLESQLQGDWFIGDKMSQVDITVAIGWQFMGLGTPELQQSIAAPRIAALAERLMALDAFSSTYPG